jgi:hypothetical protein
MVVMSIKAKGISEIHKIRYSLHVEEAMAFCPHCKALQTVWLSGGVLMPTRKFYQIADHIYHDCGSGQPCHLYLNG